MQSYHKLRKALNAISKDFILRFDHEQLDEIATILSLYKADDKGPFPPTSWDYPRIRLMHCSPLSFSKAGNLSLTAMKNLSHLETGENYDEACRTVYGDHRGHQSGQRYRTLTLNQELRETGALDAITNPVVLRALSQTTKVLNAIIRRYGSPQRISIELAREMKNNFEQRRKLDVQNQKNQEKNSKIMAQIEDLKGAVLRADLVKFKLYQEQDGVCLYSGTQSDIGKLFDLVTLISIISSPTAFLLTMVTKQSSVRSKKTAKRVTVLPLEYLSADPVRAENFISWSSATS